MKKYFVIGNPISHSLSPELHNFWIKKNNINALYEKISIINSKKNYNHVYRAPYDIDRIISDRIKWILERI